MPLLATNGDQFLVVWSDSRSGTGAVYAARMDRTGRILDPAGIRVSESTTLALGMATAWIGSSYLIAYTTWDPDGGYSIRAARIAPDGRVLARDAVLRRGTTPRLASSGSAALLLYKPWPENSLFGVSAAILDENGAVHGDTALLSSSFAFPLGVAWNGKKFFAIWRDLEQIVGIALVAEGPSPGLQTISTDSSTGFDVTVATDGSGFLVVWREFQSSGSRIRGRFISPDGVIAGEPFFITPYVLPYFESDVIWDGSHYVVSYLVSSSSAHTPFATYLETVEVSPSGEVGPRTVITTGVSAESHSTIAAGGRILFAWSDNRLKENLYESKLEVFVRMIGGLESRSDTLLSRSHSAQSDADAVWTGDSYLAAWTEAVSSNQLQGVVAGRLARDGRPIDGPGVRLQFSSRGQYWPSVSFNGSSSLVVWTEGDPIRGAAIYGGRISPDGHRLDSDAFLIALGVAYSSAVVGWDGTRHLVVYQHSASARLRGQFITPEGHLDGTAFPISHVSTHPGWQGNPDLAWNGRNYLVVWERFEDYVCQITCGLIPGTPAGVLLSPSGAALGPEIKLGPKFSGRPRVAGSATGFLVVNWVLGRARGQRVSPEGVILDNGPDDEGFLIDRAHSQPQLAWMGREYQVAFWKDDHVEVARISGEGRIIDRLHFSEARRDYEGTVELAAGPESESLLIYAKVDPLLDVHRLFARAGNAIYPHRRRPARP